LGPGGFTGPSNNGDLGDLTRAAPAPALPPLPTSGPRARPRGGDAVQPAVPLPARVAAPALRIVSPQHAAPVRWPAGPRTCCGTCGTGPGSLRRPRAVTEAGSPPQRIVVAGGAPPRAAVAARDGDGGAPRPAAAGRVRWRWFVRPGRQRGGARRAAPSSRDAAEPESGGGGDGVDRRRSRSAAGLRPLVRSESATSPLGLSPMDTQLGAPIRAS
jgi:hypothetical protein